MKANKERFVSLCVEAMRAKGLFEDEQYRERITDELKAISLQGKHDYFLDLYDTEVKYPYNEKNLLVVYLLGLAPDFDIGTLPSFKMGEFPDIDVDFLPVVRDYLKKDYIPKKFGENKVCSISNYTTFGIKSALVDMARIHGYDRNEILSITTQIGLKDDDGKALTWEKAVATHKPLQEYLEDKPEVADAARRLLNRNRGRGKHAGGLVISSKPIDDVVPLVLDSEGNPCSAWTEGLAAQDLQPMGYIKFDLLVITDLLRIVECCKLIKKRHPEFEKTGICANPDMPDWSDISYLNDPKSLALANEGKLKGVFQFDSDGIRRLCRDGGVTSFEDIPAYSSLYRPGPLGMNMEQRYIKRKKGEEQGWEAGIHPSLKPIVEETYGILCYQEQIMKMLGTAGNIPSSHQEIVRKAISKKKEETFRKYKEMFLEEGQKTLGWPVEALGALWNQIESFAEYGFNKSHAVAYSYVSSRLLYLKANFPREFYATTLALENETDKIVEYRREAENDGFIVNKLDLNKSGVEFQIVDDEIYVGFSNIKGIGHDVAEEIVRHQPYDGIEDFLSKFGTNANVLKPLIGLCLFGDPADRGLHMEFTEYFKKEMTKRNQRDKRHETSKEKYIDEMRFVVSDFLGAEMELEYEKHPHKWFATWIEHGCFDTGTLQAAFPDWCPKDKIEAIDFIKVIKKYRRSVESNQKKQDADDPIQLEVFEPSGEYDPKMQDLYKRGIEVAESLYYGFEWRSVVCRSPDYDPERTFAQFDDESNFGLTCTVQVVIKGRPIPRTTKKAGKPYWILPSKDANGRQERIVIWKEDYEKFQTWFETYDEDEERGLIFSMKINPWYGNMFTLWSPPRNQKVQELGKTKEDDPRVFVLAEPEKEQTAAIDAAVVVDKLGEGL